MIFEIVSPLRSANKLGGATSNELGCVLRPGNGNRYDVGQPFSSGVSRPRWAAAAAVSGGGTVRGLDGVRAVAIAAVLADHGGVQGLSGGFIGVDMFFVLSGFLITSLLLAEQNRTGRIDLAGFWTRRARRLLPAMVVLVVVVGLARRLFPDDAVVGLRSDALSALGWVGNWRFESELTDYFAQGGTASPLQHTWSLGVEEQYYLMWPLLLVAVSTLITLPGWRNRDRRGRVAEVRRWAIGGLAAIGAALSAIEAVALTSHGRLGRVYFGTDTRAQALLLGALTAAVLASRWSAPATELRSAGSAVLGRFLLLGGLTCLAVALTTATGDVGEFHRGLLTGVALAAAAVVAGVMLDPGGPVTRALATQPMVGLGRISYGVYLWHWPAFLALDGARTGLTGLPLFGLRCAATLLLAAASWVLVERPTRRWRPSPRRLLPAVAAAVAAAAALLVVGVPTGHAPEQSAAYLPPGVPTPDIANGPGPIVESASIDSSGTPTPTPTRTPTAASTGTPPASSAPNRPERVPATATRRAPSSARATATPAMSTPPRTRDPRQPLRIDVFGDSIAWTLMRYLPKTPGLTFTDHTALGCGIVQGGPYRYFGDISDQRPVCDAWPRTWAAQIAADRPDVALLLVGRWETMDRMHDGQWMHLGDSAFDTYISAQLGKAFAVLGRTGAQVVAATEPYNRRGEKSDGSLFPEDQPVRVDRWNSLLRQAAANHPAIDILDLNRKLCPDGVYTQDVEGLRVRSDGVHLTPGGVSWLTPWLVNSLRSTVH